MAGNAVADAISRFGAGIKPKFAKVVEGAPEDQLRGPLETLIHDFAIAAGLPAGSVHLIGETTLADIKTRPDFAVTVSKALVGFIEVKAPGKGADPRRFDNPHDKDQWDKLKSLPNLLYTDGNAFSLWRDGKLEREIVRLDGNVETSGTKLAAPTTLLPLISDFLRWSPIPPKTAKQLAQVSARLCRLLRDEVVEQMALGSPGTHRTGAGLAQASVSAGGRCAVRRRLRAGGDLRPSGRAGARHFIGARHGRCGAGAAQIELADRNRAQAT